jgi:DNA-binding transcriptional regulator PaaX
MKIKRKIKNEDKNIQKMIEDFLHSESIPATTTKFLLMFLALGGVALGGAIVPGLLKALKEFGLSEEEIGFDRKKINNAIRQLKRKKMVEIIKDDDGKVSVRLTNKGRDRVREFSIDTIFIKKSKKWDGRWRILIFDIPTRPKIYNQAREALRAKIKELGFYQMQKSVWVYPYDFEDEILFIAEAFSVEKHIEIITSEKLLHGENLKSIFGL